MDNNQDKKNKNEEERHATWLELFYDLVFVVTVSQLAHYLLHDISLSNFFRFLFLFIPVWWSWIGTTFYATRFYSDDGGHRLLLLLQMGGAIAMAVNISSAFNNSLSGFAISYAFMRLILVIEYVRVFRAIKSSESESANPLVKRYIIGFSIAVIIWLISAFVPFTDIRFALWVVGLIVDFATPISTIKLPKFAPHISHLPVRMGLFTIIVLGESIISIVTGLTEQVLNVYSVIVASLGLCVSFSLWWLYFDSTGRLPIQILREKGRTTLFSIWLFTHFPLVVAITAVGVGIRRLVSSEQHSVLSTSDLWLICGSVSISFISQSILHLVSIDRDTHDYTRRKMVAISRIVSAIVIISIPILLNNYGIPIIIASLITGICGFQIVFDLKYHHHHRI